MNDDPYIEWDAAYVVGSLPIDERLEYERHLASCDQCTAAVAELAGLPGLLGKLPADEAVEISYADPKQRHADLEPETSLASVAHRASRRRRRRRAWAAASSILAVVAAVLGGLAIGTSSDHGSVRAGSAMITAAPEADNYAMSGGQGFAVSLAVKDASWGTRFDWGCSYGSENWAEDGSVRYDLLAVRTDGETQVVGTWTAVGRSARGLAAVTSIPRAKIAAVQVRLHGAETTIASVKL